MSEIIAQGPVDVNVRGSLLPCPYCGDQAQHYPDTDGQANAIYCKTCPVGVEHAGMPDDELARIWDGLPRTEKEALTDSYVQRVPDKCDRVVWRGQYIHLPTTPNAELCGGMSATNAQLCVTKEQ